MGMGRSWWVYVRNVRNVRNRMVRLGVKVDMWIRGWLAGNNLVLDVSRFNRFTTWEGRKRTVTFTFVNSWERTKRSSLVIVMGFSSFRRGSCSGGPPWLTCRGGRG
jgi:hypothetical protein